MHPSRVVGGFLRQHRVGGAFGGEPAEDEGVGGAVAVAAEFATGERVGLGRADGQQQFSCSGGDLGGEDGVIGHGANNSMISPACATGSPSWGRSTSSGPVGGS